MDNWHTSISRCRSTSVSHTSGLHFTKFFTFLTKFTLLIVLIIIDPKKMLNGTLEQQRMPTHWRQYWLAELTHCTAVVLLICFVDKSTERSGVTGASAGPWTSIQLSPVGRRALSPLPTSYWWTAHRFVLPGYHPAGLELGIWNSGCQSLVNAQNSRVQHNIM